MKNSYQSHKILILPQVHPDGEVKEKESGEMPGCQKCSDRLQRFSGSRPYDGQTMWQGKHTGDWSHMASVVASVINLAHTRHTVMVYSAFSFLATVSTQNTEL